MLLIPRDFSKNLLRKMERNPSISPYYVSF